LPYRQSRRRILELQIAAKLNLLHLCGRGIRRLEDAFGSTRYRATPQLQLICEAAINAIEAAPGGRGMITKQVAFGLTVLAACQAFAHHSPAAFDVNRRVSIRGEVSRYIWRNPHVYIYVNGTDDSGTAAEWQIEGDPTPLMSRSGWSASTLASGDFVSLVMHPDRDTTRRHGLPATLGRAKAHRRAVSVE